jgi:hypothetical protein
MDELQSDADAVTGGRDATSKADPTALADAGSRAARLLGSAEALREVIGAPLFPSEKGANQFLTSRVRDLLGASDFEAAWAQGRAMSWEEAVAHARD